MPWRWARPFTIALTGSSTRCSPGSSGEPAMTDLHGQVALVTGASRGIGQAIAIRLGQLGASVAVNYSRDAAGASQTVSSIEAAGSLAIGVPADVSKPAEVKTLFQACQARFGGVDIVVANAGVDEPGGVIIDVTEADYDRMYAVNARGAFFTLQQAARSVRDGGSIIYIGSSSTLSPAAGFGLYASSKLAPAVVVRALAQEIGAPARQRPASPPGCRVARRPPRPAHGRRDRQRPRPVGRRGRQRADHPRRPGRGRPPSRQAGPLRGQLRDRCRSRRHHPQGTRPAQARRSCGSRADRPEAGRLASPAGRAEG